MLLLVAADAGEGVRDLVGVRLHESQLVTLERSFHPEEERCRADGHPLLVHERHAVQRAGVHGERGSEIRVSPKLRLRLERDGRLRCGDDLRDRKSDSLVQAGKRRVPTAEHGHRRAEQMLSE